MLDELKPYQELEPGRCNCQVPPNIQVMMTGVHEARQYRDGTIELFYTDGTRESAACPDRQLHMMENWFEIVGLVQERARGEQPKITLTHVDI